MGQIAVMGNKKTLQDIMTNLGLDIPVTGGDTKIIWDVTKPDEVDVAKHTFDELKKKGYSAFSVKGDGERNSRVDAFDSKAEKLIFVPPMKGG